MEGIKCVYCDEEIKDNEERARLFIDKHFFAHEICRIKAEETASKLFCILPKGRKEYNYSVIFDEFFARKRIGSNGKSLIDYPWPVKKQLWGKDRSNPKIGYTEWEYKTPYIEYAEGWMTGHPDSTTERKVEVRKLFDDLIQKKIYPPVEVYLIFGKTSNIFSQSVAIVISSLVQDTFNAFMEEEGWGYSRLVKGLE